ncbi:MAG: response regulator [Gammaproteobacteria bacterium]|nr:response regulator [Gammaproteobacteria bacterium]
MVEFLRLSWRKKITWGKKLSGSRCSIHHQKENLPVIAVSAHATKDMVKKGLDDGFMEYVTKPIDLPKLKQTLLNYLHITH